MGLELKMLQDKLAVCKKEYEGVVAKLELLEQQRLAVTQKGLKLEGAIAILSDQVLLLGGSLIPNSPVEAIVAEEATGCDKIEVVKREVV